MAGESAPLAVSFLRSAPQTMATIGPRHVRQWADLGRRLYKGNWKSSSLAGAVLRPRRRPSSMFSASARRRAWSSSSMSFRATATNSPPPAWRPRPSVLQKLDEDDRLPFIAFAVELAQSSWADSRLYFERGAPLSTRCTRPCASASCCWPRRSRAATTGPRSSTSRRAAAALGELEPDDHYTVHRAGRTARTVFAYAAMDFVASVPTRPAAHSHRRARAPGTTPASASSRSATTAAKPTSASSPPAARTSSRRFPPASNLSKVGEILRLYCKALTGRNVAVQIVVGPRREGHRLGQRDIAPAPKAPRSSCPR